MSMRFTQLQCKEVICVSDGRRLGFVTDVQVEIPSGNVCAIVVPCPARFPGGFGRRDDFIIPWNCIKRIGPDIVLVEAKPTTAGCREESRGCQDSAAPAQFFSPRRNFFAFFGK